MTENAQAYTVTAGPARSRDERFSATYWLQTETIALAEDWADAAGVTPSDVIDVAVRQLALLARRDEEGKVDEYGRAWLDGYFRSGKR